MKMRFYPAGRTALKGFTLLELIVVIAIIVVMASIIVPNVIGQRRLARIQSANDKAYEVYVAAQEYMNYLQKYNKDPKYYFGTYQPYKYWKSGKAVKVEGSKTKRAEPRVGFLACNGGVMSVNTAKCYHDHVVAGEGDFVPTDDMIAEAFRGIVEKRMGRNVVTKKEAEQQGYVLGNVSDKALVSLEMNQGSDGPESFLVMVFPETYTVRNVYFTTYRTEGEWAKINAIYHRVNNAALTYDDGSKEAWSFLFRGFSCTEETNLPYTYSQEKVTKKFLGARFAGDLDQTYYPCYLGQYPIPAYTIQ